MATPLLKQGSRGAEVRQLQQFLKDKGYYKGNVDAIFGPQTAAAVKAFQQAQGLKVDAIVGPQTWGAINALKAASQPAKTTASKPASTTTPKTAAQSPTVPQNAPLGYLTYTPLTDEELRRMAEERVSPTYSANVEAAKQAAERSKQALEQQKEQIERLYGTRRSELQELYDIERQRASDEALKRGLARSSYAADRQAQVGELEAKALQQLQSDLALDIKQIDQQIVTLEQQLADSLKRLDIDRATEIRSIIDQLKQEQENKLLQIQQYNNQLAAQERQEQFQREQFDWQKALQEWEKQFKQKQFDWQKYIDQQQLALAKARAAGGGGRGRATTSNVSPYQLAYNNVFNSKDPVATFNSKKYQYMSVLSSNEFQALQAAVNAYAAQRKSVQTTPKSSTSTNLKSKLQQAVGRGATIH